MGSDLKNAVAEIASAVLGGKTFVADRDVDLTVSAPRGEYHIKGTVKTKRSLVE
ncbi:hypothetical protein MUP77_01310 [Candidatus Bathyarchaeota archaeon]|nr:hypothetical protein [Candidatus Bathyarchaeota archaeon]